jgi:hypothetical protein
MHNNIYKWAYHIEQINQPQLIPEAVGSWPEHAARNLICHLLLHGKFS